MAKTYQTPGVYIEEKSAFPNSAVPVATAVPAFIGYTEIAVRDKKPLTLQPTRISSYGEFRMFFGGAAKTTLTIGASEEAGIPYKLNIENNYFTLHSQMKMFFSNGGSDCYIVSVGSYEAGKVSADTLQKGIEPLLKVMEPTMVVIPELMTILPERNPDGKPETEDIKAGYGVYGAVLNHCGAVMRNRFAILDVWMDREKHKQEDYTMDLDIQLFREEIGTTNLSWGAAYYPWLETTAVSASELDILNVENRGTAAAVTDFPEGTFTDGVIADKTAFQATFLAAPVNNLTAILDRSVNQRVFDGELKVAHAKALKEQLKAIETVTTATVGALTQTLATLSPMFKALMKDVRKELNLLPPSAAMAGIYAMVDNTVGVFQSPANVGVGSVIQPAINISNEQQEDLNVPIDGKAVNAIRSFPGRGVLVWGARTLDGNSNDWRYISVRRTVIFIEQSIKYAAEPYVFEPNTAATWSNMKAMITNFLTNVWQQGALAGATPDDAFSVNVGLGTTMTPVDILDGYLRISVTIAVMRPAEFIVITFEQKMQQS